MAALLVCLNLGQVLRHLLVILRKLKVLRMRYICGTLTEFLSALLAISQMSVLQHSLTMRLTEGAHRDVVCDLILDYDVGGSRLRMLNGNWLLNWRWVETSLRVLPPTCG